MPDWASWLPGSGLLKQAWDATKLAGLIIDKRKEQKALVVAEKRNQVEQFKGKKATKKVREIVEQKNYRELARLFLPDKAIALTEEAVETWWKIWDLYWIFAVLRSIHTRTRLVPR